MSRKNDETPVGMSSQRRSLIMEELQNALDGAAAPFPRERFIVTCVRIDGAFNELVGVIESDGTASWLRLGAQIATDPPQAAAEQTQTQGSE